ncbi:PAS domain-containing protein [Marinoscillum sp.]|uniref:PAS domain-containing protein n=1 Tax=Marinoscillum sp. TaxID=2024838 RepID=UPI003BAB2453
MPCTDITGSPYSIHFLASGPQYSESLIELVGPTEEVSLESILACIYPDDQQVMQESWDRLMQDEMIDIPLSFRVKDGDTYRCLIAYHSKRTDVEGKTYMVQQFYDSDSIQHHIKQLQDGLAMIRQHDPEDRCFDLQADRSAIAKVAKFGAIAWYEHYKMTNEVAYSENMRDLFQVGDDEEFSIEYVQSLALQEDRNRMNQRMSEADPSNPIVEENIRFVLNGQLRLFNIKVELIWREGEVVKSFSVIRDITDLEKSKSTLNQFKHITGLGWYEVDYKNNTIDAAGRFFEILGVSKGKKLKVEDVFDRVHQEDLPIVKSLIADSNQLVDHTFRIFTDQGRMRYVKAFGDLERDTEGNLLRSIGVIVDITESVNLKYRNAKVENLAKVGWYEASFVDDHLEGSEEFYRIHGIEDRPVYVGNAYRELVFQEDLSVFDFFQEIFQEGNEQSEWTDVSYRIRTPQGQVKYLKSHGEIYRDASGTPVSILGVVFDVTEEEQHQLQLKHVQEMAQVAWMKIDSLHPEKTVTSGTYLQMHHLDTIQEAIHPQSFLRSIHPEDWEVVNQLTENIRNNHLNQWEDVVYRVLKDDGSFRYLLCKGEVERGDDHSVKSVLLVVSDISDLAAKEQLLEQAQHVASIGWFVYDLLNVENSQCSQDYLRIHAMEHLGRFPSPEELNSVILAEDMEKLEKGRQEYQNAESEYSIAYRVNTGDGVRHVLSKSRLIRDHKTNKLIKVIGTAQDVTEIKETEEKLLWAQQISNTGWYEYDIHYPEKSKFSDMWLQMHDFTPGHQPNFKEYLNRVHPKERDILGDDINLYIKSLPRKWDTLEYRIVISNGQVRYINNSSEVLYKDGKPYKVFGVTTDITEVRNAQKALYKSEKMYRLLSETNRDVTVLLRVEQCGPVISYVSKSVYNLLSYHEEELIGRPIKDMLHPEDVITYIQKTKSLLDSGKSATVSFRLQHKDQSYVWVESVVNYIEDKEQMVRLSIRDITERRTYENQLITANEELKALITSTDHLVFAFDQDGRFERVIGREERFHIPSADFIGHPVEKIWDDPNGIEMSKLVRKSLANQTYEVFECDHMNHLGEKLYLRVTYHPYQGMVGDTKLCVVIEDITEHHHYEQKLLSANGELNALIKATGNLVFAFDQEGYFERVIGDPHQLHIPAAEFEGHAVEEIWNDANGIAMSKLVRESLQSGLGESITCDYLDAEGAMHHHLVTSHPYQGKDGSIKVCVIKEDITAQKVYEQELTKTVKMERELSGMRSNFVAMASHQFRTPLTVIKSNMQLLETAKIKHPIVDRVTVRLIREVDRLTALMEDILVLGKVQSNQLKTKRQLFDLEDLVEDVQLDIKATVNDGRELEVSTVGHPQKFTGDYHLMRHALSNVVNNASKYSPDGRNPELTIDYSDDRFIKLHVRDYGVGIPDEDLKRIFQDFYRSDNVKNIPGTGLGMSIAREFLKLNDCGFTVTSKVGEGSTFTLLLPKYEQHETPVD